MGNVNEFEMGKVGHVKRISKPEILVRYNGRIPGMRVTKLVCKSSGRFVVVTYWS